MQRLARLLAETGRVTIVGADDRSARSRRLSQQHPVDVLFLDIQMPGLTGFELLERLERAAAVVFTTAYDRYALDAFEVNSVDYLLKPIEPERLDRALDKLAAACAASRGRTSARWRASSRRSWRRPRLERIASRVGERTTVLDVARISHFVSKDKLTFAVVNGREHVIDYTLAELEERLDPRRFVRIHRVDDRQLAASCRSCFRRSTAACWSG